jgi:hypothetical protein
MFGLHNLTLNVTNMWNDKFKTSQQLWIDMKKVYVCKKLYIEQDFNNGQLYQIMLTLKIMWTNFLSNMNFFIGLENGKSKTRC